MPYFGENCFLSPTDELGGVVDDVIDVDGIDLPSIIGKVISRNISIFKLGTIVSSRL